MARVRIERFTWQWADTAWIVVTALGCVAFTPRHDGSHVRLAIGLFLSILSASAVYLAGLRMHSRVAGIASAVLVATSPNYAALCVEHPVSGAIACATILAVASYSIGWMIVTYCAACLSFTLGFNGALVGTVIALVPGLQKKEHASAAMIGYVAFAMLWSLATLGIHMPQGFRTWASWRDAAPLGGLAVLVIWFFVPFYAEATLRGARERWLLALALVGVLVFILFTSTSAIVPQLYDAYPIAMLVVGVALARLIPLISGDYPAPSKRYLSAVLAVAATVLLKFALEPATSHAVAAPAVYRSTGGQAHKSVDTRKSMVRNHGFTGAISDKAAVYGNKEPLDCFASRLPEVGPVELCREDYS